jgi:hypothetical protein
MLPFRRPGRAKRPGSPKVPPVPENLPEPVPVLQTRNVFAAVAHVEVNERGFVELVTLDAGGKIARVVFYSHHLAGEVGSALMRSVRT